MEGSYSLPREVARWLALAERFEIVDGALVLHGEQMEQSTILVPDELPSRTQTR